MYVSSKKAPEEGNILFEITLASIETGEVVIPTAFTYTLSLPDGTIVNAISGVAATPGAPTQILLSGNDLAYTDGETDIRILTVMAVYSSTLGTITEPERIQFRIEPFEVIS